MVRVECEVGAQRARECWPSAGCVSVSVLPETCRLGAEPDAGRPSPTPWALRAQCECGGTGGRKTVLLKPADDVHFYVYVVPLPSYVGLLCRGDTLEILTRFRL